MNMTKQYFCTYERSMNYFKDYEIITVHLGSNLLDAFAKYKKLQATDKIADGVWCVHKDFTVKYQFPAFHQLHSRCLAEWERMQDEEVFNRKKQEHMNKLRAWHIEFLLSRQDKKSNQ